MNDRPDEELNVEPPSEPVPEPVLVIDAAHRINFASAQNAVPVLRSLRLENPTDRAIGPVTVTLQSHPAFCRGRSWTIDRVAAGDDVEITDRALTFDAVRLAGLNEAEHGEMVFTLDAGDGALTQQNLPVELLARDEWGGLGDMAQLLAAFVSPNDPAIPGILKTASGILAKSGHSHSLEGYQRDDPARVYMLAAAIWSALTGMGLTYAHPPKSFEIAGQKIRDPGRIEMEGLATCLDTVLLACAALEAAGLNSAAVFTTGHAICGVWLVDKGFKRASEPDITELRKAIAAREFIVFETTFLTARPSVGFDQAIERGRAQLSEARETEFQTAIDISRARNAGIRPLATHRTPPPGEEGADNAGTAPAALPKPPDFGLLPGERVDEKPATPLGRIERWQRKLLDLSLRNRLLNFSATKQTLPFLCPDISGLEDHLSKGGRMRIIALKEDDPVGERDPELIRQTTGRDLEADFAVAAQGRNEICAPLHPHDMQGRLITLFRKAKSDLAEGGTNTLFLTVGFLRWRKTATDKRVYRAPLLLMPVRLTRKSAHSDFHLAHHEDEIRINATLLQFLERDFGVAAPGLVDELPMDDSGVDVPMVLEIMRRHVRDIPGFEVVEEIALSTFSFAKYLMWKDLVDRQDDLRENRLVRHLIDNPEKAFQGGDGAMPDPREIDRRVAPADLLTPLPADSSQLAAVVAAASGRDFVVIGPPGTGKSQTIANMIAHCLAKGKSVLFVAEKSAALDVVYRRLCAYGLGELCLELHSNKSERKSVVTQLGAAWDRAAGDSGSEWVKVTDGVRLHRDQLNAYVDALHAKGSHGYSVFDAIGITASATAPFSLSFTAMDSHDVESFSDLESIAQQLQRTREAVEGCTAFGHIRQGDWSFGWEGDYFAAVEALERESRALHGVADDLAAELGLPPDPMLMRTRLSLLSRFAAAARKTAAGDFSLALGRDFDGLAGEVDALEAAIEATRTQRSRLSASYADAEISRIPVEDLDRDWREASLKVWPLSSMAQAKVTKLLQSYAEAGTADPEDDIAALRELQSDLAAVRRSPLNALPGFRGAETDTGRMRDYLEDAGALRKAVRALVGEVSDITVLTRRMSVFAGAGGERDALVPVVEDFLQCRNAFTKALQTLGALAGDMPDLTSVTDLRQHLAAAVEQKIRLQDWTKWVRVRSQAEARGLGVVVDAVERGELENAEEAFRIAYFRWWLPLALDASAPLRAFSQWEHTDRIDRFRALDERARTLAAAQVRRALAHDLPARDDGVPKKSELGVLRRQLGLKRPSASIRQLIGQMPSTFTKLTPCVLMSPLSIAQYLPTAQAHFDLVIFDEASQITTWDAVGAIARGRQSVIVGDPKQLPPTNFFGRAESEEDSDLELYEEDLESILDEAAAAGLPTHQLNWHYRSRDEALIAFSNHHYYGDRLVTFPSPTTESEALVLHRVEDGVYARGEGRFNPVEAKALARYAVSRLTAWLVLPEEERETLGVITFNTQQQELILDLLDAARRDNPALEWFFSDEREEPVIVKNLENIQGDERDVMLFSITYAPDKAGKISMNFGALNRDGGERRLNVAVTRARGELHVFSSIGADRIDLTRTNAVGVKHLKNFLDYAARGAVALPGMDEGSLGDVESPFEAAVAAALRRKGWEVRPQIGVSGFRIDLGVVHPDRAGAYLAGVECDGATYHSSATARDRDAIREAVLRNLGWEILRIWSTDWFRDAPGCCERADEALRELLEASRLKMADEAAARAKAEAAAAQQKEKPPEAQPDDEDPAPALPALEAPPARDAIEQDETPLRIARGEPLSLPGPKTGAREETPAPDAERFFEPAYSGALERIISDVVMTEGPLPEALLVRKIARLHGWSRAGGRIRTRVLERLGANERHEEDGVGFLWAPGTHAPSIPFQRGRDRSARDISQAEIMGLIEGRPGVFESDDPARELAGLMGVSRLAADTRKYLEAILSRAG